ncbi:MAG: hypothetical protein WC657_02400 [Candidatus Paceibacterota bacterium]|jgi:hypothetical protein
MDHNNGVTAVVSQEVFSDIRKLGEIRQLFSDRERDKSYDDRFLAESADRGLSAIGKPVFTFTRNERAAESPWFTGDGELFKALAAHINENGDCIETGGFFVPFSNGCEIGIHGKESMASELAFVTTEQQFRETFGISRMELLAKAKKIAA